MFNKFLVKHNIVHIYIYFFLDHGSHIVSHFHYQSGYHKPLNDYEYLHFPVPHAPQKKYLKLRLQFYTSVKFYESEIK